MSKKETKKYPVLTYLCLMLLVCVLFTGVTFSRYTSSESGSVESTVSHFACSYDVTELSSTSFINSSFYLDGKPESGKMNALRTVTYTVRNYKKDLSSNPSGENLKSVMRLYGPYEFISNLAWQFDRVEGGTRYAVTPQIVMGDIVSNAPGNNTEKTYDTSTGMSYDAHAFGNTNLKLTGGVSKGTSDFYNGTIKGSWDAKDGVNGGEFEFNAYALDKAAYSLSFLRTGIVTVNGAEVAGAATTPFVVDFEEKISYCTLDIYLPDQMDFTAGEPTEKSFILFFTIVNPIDSLNNEEYTNYYTAGTTDGDYGTLNSNSSAVGYHYDAQVAVRGDDKNVLRDAADKTIKTATVRVIRKGDEYTYFKVEGSGVAAKLTELTATDGYINDNGQYYSVADLKDVFRSPEKAAGDSTVGYMISKCIDKVYNVRFRALFIQTSENGGGLS